MSVILGGAGVSGAVVTQAPTNGGASLWQGLQPTWTGWDGSVWQLGDLSSGVLLTRGGTRGLSMPPITRWTTPGTVVPGSRNRGFRVEEREVFWPIHVRSDQSSMGFIGTDRGFWRTMDPARPGVWSVTHPDGTTRYLTCRFKDDGTQSFDRLPVVMGWATYGITLVAEQPFWYGDPLSFSWQNQPDTVTPYPRPGMHDPYVLHLQSGRTLANATVTNLGDVETYPMWLLKGPFDFAAVGVNGSQVQIPFGLADGQTVTLNSDPSELTAIREDGSDVSYLLGDADWSSIPAGDSVPLSLAMVGNGSVTVTLAQRFYRAW